MTETKILLIDSDAEMLKNMGSYLSWYGYAVEALNDSAEAVSRLQDGKHNLLICDIFAVPVGGYELADMIRKSEDPVLRDQEILLVGPEELELEKQMVIVKLNAHFADRYLSTDRLKEKIDIILETKTERPV